ncbi:MAG: hypothetical protein ACJA0N_002663 [Pseudohongiellaceae bacterium]|jgi:hypothetical protein
MQIISSVLSPTFFIMLLLSAPTLNASELKPFATDGCSAFPEGTFEKNELWLNCCTLHDYAYWKGGTYTQRLKADQSLKSCVSEVGEPAIAIIMLAGVRMGGIPLLPTTFRWGYGWPYPRLYSALTSNELNQVQAHDQSFNRVVQ